jgi:glutathione S-transferase
MDARYTWIVRFDVVPEWVADGFNLDDARANEMLSLALPYAAEEHEIRAAVIAAPSATRIMAEQGYTPGTLQRETTASKEIRDGAPLAYGVDTVRDALQEALSMCDASWFAGDETTRARIAAALALLNGDDDLPNRD